MRSILVVYLVLVTSCSAVNDVIRTAGETVDSSADKALSRASQVSSATVSQAFLEADLLRANLMSDVQRERSSLETTATRLFSQVDKDMTCLGRRLDLLSIDLERTVPEIVVWMKDRDFFIRSIGNAQLVFSEAKTYDVVITGNGIGALGEDPETTETRWEIAGADLPTSAVVTTAPHTVVLRVPAERLKFEDSTVAFVPVRVSHTRKKLCGRVRYATEFHIALLPKIAATVTGVFENVVQSVAVPHEAKDPYYFKKDPSKTEQSVTRQISLPPNATVTGFAYDCRPDPNGPTNPGSYCGWCYPQRANGYGTDCETSTRPDGVTVECRRRCEAGSATIYHSVFYTVPGTSSSRAESKVTKSLQFSVPETFQLTTGNPDGNYVIEGRTSGGSPFRVLSSQRDAPELGIRSSVERAGDVFRVVVKVDGPQPYASCP